MQQPETPDTSLPPLSILALVFEDAETLWTGDAAGRLIRWQLRSGRPQQSGLISQGLPVLGLSLQLNNLWVLRPGRLEGFPLDPEATQSPIPLDLPEGLDRLVGRAGRLIAAGDQIAVVLDWLPDESRWTCTAEFGLPRGSTDDLDLSWDGQHFLVAKNKDQIWVGSTRDGSKAGGFSQKRLSQLSARFAPEAGYAYRGCRGSYEIKRVRWKTGQGKIKLETVSAWNCPIEISADGHFLAALLTGNAVQLFDLRTHQAVLYLEPVPDHGSERWKAGMSRVPAAFRHWGANLASVSRWQQPPEAGVVYASMAVAPEGKLVALGGFDGSLILVDPHTCQIQLTSPRPIETPVESPTEGQPEARRSTEIPSAVQPEAHRPVETSPAVGPADRPGSDPQRSKERARTSTRRASKPSNAPARSGWVPESILLQPACSVLLQKLQVRALGVQGQELRILDHESFLWRWAESAARPCAERLDLQPGAPEYFHQHGPLYWDREGIYLLQDRQLTAFEAATGRLVGQQPFPDTRACRAQDGKLWAYQAESSTLQWVKPGLDGAQRGELDTGLTRLARHFSLMPAGRDRLLVAGTSPQSSNPIFQVLDLRDGQKIEVGPALWAWPGADGRHFAVSRNSWSDFEVWDGEQAEAGPRLIWKNRSFPFGGLSCFTVAPGMQAILATESGHGLVVWDAQGRALAHLRGHGERIEGMLPASDGRSVHCWDRASIVRHWAVDSTWPVPVGEAEVLLQGQFQYVPPAQHRAAREAAEQRLVEDPALAQLKARIDQLQADPDALQRYAWTLPDEVHAAIDQRLTGLLGRWRPQREVQGRKVNRWVGLARSADASERATAAWAFSRLGREGKAGLEVLVELLKDPESSVRWAAVEPLRGLAPWAGEAAELLVGLLAEASKPLFSPAADALRAIGSPAAQALASALTHKKSAVREAAVDLLGDLETGAAPVSAALAEATRDRRSEGVRQAACKALGRIGPAASATVPALLERLEDKALPVQRAAARALGLLRANP